jgi:hypothetical protein
MRRYLREGKIRALRLGKDWKIPESALSDLARGGRLAKGGKPIAPESALDNTPGDFMAMLEESAPRIAAGTTRPITSDNISDAIAESRP